MYIGINDRQRFEDSKLQRFLVSENYICLSESGNEMTAHTDRTNNFLS